jgi:hypothetical protein
MFGGFRVKTALSQQPELSFGAAGGMKPLDAREIRVQYPQNCVDDLRIQTVHIARADQISGEALKLLDVVRLSREQLLVMPQILARGFKPSIWVCGARRRLWFHSAPR